MNDKESHIIQNDIDVLRDQLLIIVNGLEKLRDNIPCSCGEEE